MPERPPSRRRLFWFGLLLAAACAVGVAFWWWRGWAPATAGSFAPFAAGSSAAAQKWQRQTVGELTVEAPFRFGKGPDVSRELPEEIRALIEHWQTHEGALPSGDLRVQLSHIRYREGVAIDLDSAADGAMSNAVAALGEREPDYSVEPAQVSGLEARRSAYHGKVKGQPIHLDALFFRREQQFWQVQAFSGSDRAQQMVRRLFDSVHVLPPAAPAEAGATDTAAAPDR